MALQPSVRFDGSVHVIRFQGTIGAGGSISTFPKANGVLTTGGAVGDPRGIRLGLFDATDLTDMTRQLPQNVYDDTVPAGAVPHDPVATVLNGLIVNANEESILSKVWAQNTRLDIKGLSTNVVSFGTQESDGLDVVLDTLTSGLGLNSGLPVIIIPVILSGVEVASIDVDILIEVRWSAHR